MFLLVQPGYLALMREKPDLHYSPESIYKFILIKAHFSLLVSNQYISLYILPHNDFLSYFRLKSLILKSLKLHSVARNKLN